MKKTVIVLCFAVLGIIRCGSYIPCEIEAPATVTPIPGLSEEYEVRDENGFLRVLECPLSTFAVDVDPASYSNVRRFINDGRLPPRSAVRVEEMINYFNYDYPDPTGRDPFSVTTEVSTCPWNRENRLVHIGLQAKRLDLEELPPCNLVFLLDVSGSMAWGGKLDLVKSGMRLLVESLRKQDRVAIVVYAGSAGIVLEPTRGHKKEKILKAIDRLQASGSTAGAAGINLAYETAREAFSEEGNNRIILATDGDFNVGASSDRELVELIEEHRELGIFLTVLGVGTGNLKDAKMEKLADHGNGNYAYIDNIQEARRVLVTEMGGTLFTAAKDVKVQVEFNPARVKAYRLVGYENRLMKAGDFSDDDKDAGEMGAGHSVTALYEVIPSEGTDDEPIDDQLVYQETRIRDSEKLGLELMTMKFRYKSPGDSVSKLIIRPVVDEDIGFEQTSDDFRFSAAVAQFGLLLTGSEYTADASYEGTVDIARGALGSDPEGFRHEFVRLVDVGSLLTRTLGEAR